MMDLSAQIQLLIDNAPPDGITPQLITAIAPTLNAIAQKLSFPQYYILQNFDAGWVLTTLSHRDHPKLVKRVIYAFPTLQDVSQPELAAPNPQIVATPMPVTHILFQLVALEPVDSIVFFESPGTTNHAIEIQRTQLQQMIAKQLKQTGFSTQIPPDIA